MPNDLLKDKSEEESTLYLLRKATEGKKEGPIKNLPETEPRNPNITYDQKKREEILDHFSGV